MKGKIVLENGKEFELTEEQIKVICEAEKPAKLTGWERVGLDEFYWYISSNMECDVNEDSKTALPKKYYSIANYFSTKEKAEEVAFETELFRKLKRFADENNKKGICLECETYWCIRYMRNYKSLEIENQCYYLDFGQVYFTSKEIAEKALETFRPELEKYYGINQK